MLNQTEDPANAERNVLHSWQVKGHRPKAIAWVVCNAYGVLPYVDGVASCLTKFGIEVYAENMRGQGGRCGELTIANAGDDMTAAYRRAANKADSLKVPLVAIVHCSGTYALASAIEKGEQFSRLRSLIIYSYLHHAERLWPRTRKKLNRLGVHYDAKLVEALPSQDVIATVPCNRHIVHPTTIKSLARASPLEAKEFARRIGADTVHFPRKGYTFDSRPQIVETKFIVEGYFLPATGLPYSPKSRENT